jgi:arylsulfatase A-like enzyme/Tfp pilus assembly protein PilF
MQKSEGRRRAVALSAFCLLTSAFFLTCRPREARHFNVLLITLDTTRADHLNTNTPALTSFAKGAVTFAQAESPVPLTLPAHSSILSGVIPPHHGLRDNGGGTFPADRETLATHFQRAGYRTGAFVGSFVLDHRFGLDRGFDVYDDDIPRDPAVQALEAERRGADVVDRALAWLGRPDGRPFFAWVHLYDPHAPYAPPPPFPQTYDGELAYTDGQVARLLEDLQRRGVRENTVIAIAGDHGEALGEHGELTHGLLLYEPTLHVPMMVSSPGAKARVVTEAVTTVDLAPTLATLAGAPLSGKLDGSDLAAVILNGDKPPAVDLYAETEYPAQFGWSDLTVLRRGDRKLIRGPEPELYDLGRDPRERANQLDAQRRLYRELVTKLDSISNSAVASPGIGVDEETRAKLASLGYVAPSATAPKKSGASPLKMAPLFRQFEEAHRLMQLDRSADALAIMEQLVSADPQNAVFRATLARAWRQRGNLPRAIELYRQAVGQAPEDPEAWYNLAAAFQDAGDQQKAGEAIAEALRRDAKRPEAHNVLGIALASTGRLDAAKGEFERAVAIDPRNARAFNNLGNIARAMNRLDDAEAAYRRAIALAPRYADPLNGLGAVAVQRDKPGDALPLFDQALALDPKSSEARLNRGIALLLAGERARAVAQFRQLLAGPADDAQRQAARRLLAQAEGR